MPLLDMEAATLLIAVVQVIVTLAAIAAAYILGRQQASHQEQLFEAERHRRQEAARSMLADLSMFLSYKVRGQRRLLKVATKRERPAESIGPMQIRAGRLWSEVLLVLVQASDASAQKAMTMLTALETYNYYAMLTDATVADDDDLSPKLMERHRKTLELGIAQLTLVADLLDEMAAKHSQAGQEITSFFARMEGESP